MGTRRLREAEETAPLQATKPRLDQKNRMHKATHCQEMEVLAAGKGRSHRKTGSPKETGCD